MHIYRLALPLACTLTACTSADQKIQGTPDALRSAPAAEASHSGQHAAPSKVSTESGENGVPQVLAVQVEAAGDGTSVPPTHVIITEAVYYLGGPQQARPPEGRFPANTQVTLLQDNGAYSLVKSHDGITAHVLSASLSPLSIATP